MSITDVIDTIWELFLAGSYNNDTQVRIHIGNLLYDIDHIDTVIDMDTNRPNIVIHVKDK